MSSRRFADRRAQFTGNVNHRGGGRILLGLLIVVLMVAGLLAFVPSLRTVYISDWNNGWTIPVPPGTPISITLSDSWARNGGELDGLVEDGSALRCPTSQTLELSMSCYAVHSGVAQIYLQYHEMLKPPWLVRVRVL